MPRFPGFGERLGEKMKEAGYWKHERLDVIRFSVEHGYPTSYPYRWLEGQLPGHNYITRLARDLNTSPGWLAFGDQESPRSTPPRRHGRKMTSRTLVGTLALAGALAAGQTGPATAAGTRASTEEHRQGIASQAVPYRHQRCRRQLLRAA